MIPSLSLTLALALGAQDGATIPTADWSSQPGYLVAWGSPGHVAVGSVPSGSDFVSIGAGQFFGLAIRSDGSLVHWGSNPYGVATVPDTSGGTFQQVTGGFQHALALRSDQACVGWGRSDPPHDQSAFQAGPFQSISAYEDFSVGLYLDGTGKAWGYQEGGLPYTPMAGHVPGGAPFQELIAAHGAILGLRLDGSLAIAGPGNLAAEPLPAGPFTAIDGGRRYAVALHTDGSLRAWGVAGATAMPEIETEVPSGTDFVAVSGGLDVAAALRVDGTVVGWGGAYDAATWSPPTEGGFRQVAAGANFFVALRPCGALPYGEGLGGAHVLTLTAPSSPSLGGTFTMEVTGASLGPVTFAIAGAPAALPLFGGTLLLDPGSLILSLPAAVSAGAATVSLPVPGTLPPGLEVRAQAFAPDPAVPGFVALSNGLHLALCP